MLENLEFNINYFSISLEQASCDICHGQYMQQSQGQDRYILHIPTPPQQLGLLDLENLVQDKLSEPTHGLICTGQGACNGQRLVGTTHIQQGRHLIVWINRNRNNIDKIISPVAEPNNSQAWGGKLCQIVLAHCGNLPIAGHWLTFIRRSGVWWKVDTDSRQPVQENPFLHQARAGSTSSPYTIDILIFSI